MQLIILKEHIDFIAKLVENTDWLETAKINVLIQENVHETHWEDCENIVINVRLKKGYDKI